LYHDSRTEVGYFFTPSGKPYPDNWIMTDVIYEFEGSLYTILELNDNLPIMAIFNKASLLNSNATIKVSKIVQSYLALLASRTGSEVSELLEPLYQSLLSSLLLNRPFRSKNVDQQVGLGSVLRGPLKNATNDVVGGGNDSTAGGGVLVIGGLSIPNFLHLRLHGVVLAGYFIKQWNLVKYGVEGVMYRVIVDFSLAREIASQPPYTEYVSTRCEVDEIYKICSVIGSLMEFTRREGLERASKIRYQFPEVAGVNISVLIPSASKEAVNLIGALCSWDPSKRPTAVEALQHPFFQAATARMSPSVGLNGRVDIEHNYATGYSVFLPNVKPATAGLMEKNGGVYDTAEKLAPMTIRSTRVMAPRQQEQRVYIPPPVKAGIRNER
ncbi:cyclin-dependent kinase F-4-like protein isoform X1, partial [Tanacetum coccineum]